MMTYTTDTCLDPRLGMKPHGFVHCRTYSNFWVGCLTPEQHARTCGYWYTVTAEGSLPHTAFATREQLFAWIAQMGLTLAADLPAEGACGCQRLLGTYHTATHCSYDDFYSLDGQHIRTMSNGRYTLGILTQDTDGVRTLHTLNCNLRYRPEYDYAESRAMGS